ncbi:MAG: hypothetical protein Q9220_004981 [cf. Caloplaca sp. 1 TL-2023]
MIKPMAAARAADTSSPATRVRRFRDSPNYQVRRRILATAPASVDRARKIIASFAPPSPRRNAHTNPVVVTPGYRRYWWAFILVAIAVAIAAIVFYPSLNLDCYHAPTIISPKSAPTKNSLELDCDPIIATNLRWNYIPLSLDEPLLYELPYQDALHAERQLHLKDLQPRINVSMEIVDKELMHLVCALRNSRSAAKKSTTTMSNVILMNRRMDSLLSDMSQFKTYYDLILADFSHRRATAQTAHDEVRNGTSLMKIVVMSPLTPLRWLGISPMGRLKARYIAAHERLEQIKSEIETLERAQNDLVKRKDVAQEINEGIRSLLTILIENDEPPPGRYFVEERQNRASSQRSLDQMLEGNEPNETRVKDWLRAHTARYLTADKSSQTTQRHVEQWWVQLGCWCAAWNASENHQRWP